MERIGGKERERKRDDSLKAHFNTSVPVFCVCLSETILITYKTSYIYTAG